MPTESKNDVQFISIGRLIALTTCYSLATFYMGYVSLSFNAVDFDIIYQIFHLSLPKATAEGLLSGILFLGALLGGLLTGSAINNLSRRQCCFLFQGVTLIGTLLTLIPNEITLFLGRFVQGVSVAPFSALIPIIVKEMAPVQISGMLLEYQLIYLAIGYLCGPLFVYILLGFIKESQLWFFTFGIIIPVILIQMILLCLVFVHETPKYLLIKGKSEEAKIVLGQIFKEQYIQENYHRILADLEADNDELEDKQKQYPTNTKLGILLSTFILIFQVMTGINVIIMFERELAETFIPQYATLVPILINAFKLFSSFFSILLLKYFGRRPIFIHGTLLMALFLITLGIGLDLRQFNEELARYLVLSSIALYCASFVNSWGCLLWIYPNEIIQPVLYSRLALLIWITNWILITLYPIIREKCGDFACPKAFYFFAICMLIAAIFFKAFLVETKNKTELQIREQFNIKWQ